MMGMCHLRCKNRTLRLCSVSLLRVGDKFCIFIEFTFLFYFIYFILLLFLYYCPKLGQQFFTKWCYSPNINSFRFGSALNPDSSIRMNCQQSMVLFSRWTLLCRVYRPCGLVLCHRLCNRSQHVCYFHVYYCDQSGIACSLQFYPSQLRTECRRACLIQIQLHLVRLFVQCGMLSKQPKLHCQ